jgi:threonine/homoserine/homoserine lactone efflux protein
LPAFLVGLGSTAADLFYVLLVYLGVAPLIQNPLFRIPLDGAAAVVLGMLAWGGLQEARRPASGLPGGGAPPVSARRGALASGFLITLSNPMTIVFYFSLFGGAVARLHEAPRSVHFLYVIFVMTGCVLWSAFLAIVLGWGKGRLSPRAVRVVGVVSALALVYFAARFLFDGLLEIHALLSGADRAA